MNRRMVVGTGWKMNINAAQTREYAAQLQRVLDLQEDHGIDMFVLPPFTSLHAAKEAFAHTSVHYGAQNMHWAEQGAWTGEISASMLVDAGCRYVELAHSERLAHFNETYSEVRQKVNAALRAGLQPILCLGEMAHDRDQGRSDDVLLQQASEALADVEAEQALNILYGYEPRWAIGSTQAAPVDYVTARHQKLRQFIRERFGADVAEQSRIMYGGSVTPSSGEQMARVPDVDGLFVGRAAWTPEGFAQVIQVVRAASAWKEAT